MVLSKGVFLKLNGKPSGTLAGLARNSLEHCLQVMLLKSGEAAGPTESIRKLLGISRCTGRTQEAIYGVQLNSQLRSLVPSH
jgi:hypothetical protein